MTENRHQFPESDPRHHTVKIQPMLKETIAYLCEGAGMIQDPKARALFETSAEVLTGLLMAYTDFGQG